MMATDFMNTSTQHEIFDVWHSAHFDNLVPGLLQMCIHVTNLESSLDNFVYAYSKLHFGTWYSS
jgi:hypothetical protein